MPSRFRVAALLVSAIAVAAGCSSSPTPEPTPPPPSSTTAPRQDTGFTKIVSGADDSVGATVGSPNAAYRYRFRQVDPASDRFTFQDRDLSFYFRPSPDALHFQVENRQDRPVWIEWDRSAFITPLGARTKVAHSNTRWQDRFTVQTPTQILGLQHYGGYALSLDDLLDPAGSTEQLHRPLFPEDDSAVRFNDSTFGVDLVFRIEDRPRPYSFRFKVASVIPR